MRRSLPQTLLFVLALIVASCQCVLTCFGEPTQTVPETCAHARVVAEHRAPSTFLQTFAQLPHDVVAVLQRTHFFLSASTQQTARYTTSPPPSPELIRSTVLRV